ncbi:hypothetical protein LZ24_00679 [Desulfobotulus alkaliphilus]|uniref:Uncharacterized protein n=1 Tax=Desulfobotulus alkaliphilus TaxID=622671 RepID=A0A562S354_9BACT|nr:hypothetical protein [Desulfobotulus alkaliphilus]TWI75628.1 hypothetical protein LZ24_00679 [Desulfobotulus alkaliphilus]
MQRRVLFVILFFIFAGLQPLQAKEKVVIFPPVVHASEDLSFLADGVQSLLDAQLDAEGWLTRNTEEASFEIRTRITAFGGTMITDFALISRKTDNVHLSQRRSTKDETEILPEVTAFGDQVLAFLQKTTRPAPTVKSASQIPEPQTAADPKPSFEVLGISSPHKGAVVAMDKGDLTGNGEMEIVFADRREVRIMDAALQSTLASFSLPHHENILQMHVLDTKRNGRAEIWLTAVNPGNERMRSRVLVLEKNTIHVAAGPENRFFARGRNAEGGDVILTRLRGFRDRLFSGPVMEAVLGEKGIDLRESSHPENHLFDAIPVRFRTDMPGDRLFIAENGTLSLVSGTEETLWESRKSYGGIPVSMDFSRTQSRHDEKSRYYFSGRTRILSPTGDSEDLLAIHNAEAAGGLFQRLRIFRTGSLHLLSWNGYEMEVSARTPDLDGYIADFIHIPARDGEPARIILALVKGGGDLSLSPETRFVNCVLFH